MTLTILTGVIYYQRLIIKFNFIKKTLFFRVNYIDYMIYNFYNFTKKTAIFKVNYILKTFLYFC